MRLVNNRLLARALLQIFLSVIFFWLGIVYNRHLTLASFMSPEHAENHPELAQAWHTGHIGTFSQVLVSYTLKVLKTNHS